MNGNKKTPLTTSNALARPRLGSRMLVAVAKVGQAGRVLSPQLDLLRVGGGLSLASLRQGRRDEEALLAATHNEIYRGIWAHAAKEVGAEIAPLPDDFFLLRKGANETVVFRQLVMLDHPATTALALNKSLVHHLLESEGLPIPPHVGFDRSDRRGAVEFIHDATRPGKDSDRSFVVKPAIGTAGGTGVTCNVVTEDDLVRAWVAAGRWDRRILVERQTPGDEYRMLFLDGELTGVVRRMRPRVTGDGARTVAELVGAENARRSSLGSGEVARLVKIDLDCELALRSQGLTTTSVLERGREAVLKGTVSQNGTADNYAVPLGDVSPALIDEASRAASLVKLRLAGVDIMTPDITSSLKESGGAIIEVNGTPGFHYHYQVANPAESVPVAAVVLRKLLGDG